MYEVVILAGPRTAGQTESENVAKRVVLDEFPGAEFDNWEECNEPEAVEGEEIMYAYVDGEPVAAVYMTPEVA